MLPLGSKLSDETTDDTESFLPASAESTEVVRKLEPTSRRGRPTPGSSSTSAGGLTAADKQKIAADAKAIEAAGNDKIPLVEPPTVPFAPGPSPALVSQNGEVATMVLTSPPTSTTRPTGAS